MRHVILCFAALAIVVTCGGCSNNSTTTAPTMTSSSPATDTFASQLAPHGSAAQTFVMSSAGTVKVTLTALGDGTISAGLGVGVTGATAPCSLAQSTITGPGSSPQILLNADAGTYCAQVFDSGSLTTPISFSMTIEHP